MSTLKVEVVRVEKVEPHPNADRLDIATIKGWQCVVGKGEFNQGDNGFYFPIDSVLPEVLLSVLFSGTKVKPPSRIKTIKLRGAISQGLLVKEACSKSNRNTQYIAGNFSVGCDVTDLFGVSKYEPPASKQPNHMKASGRVNHPDFHKYTDIENWKNYPDVFTNDEYVVITEKIHGTNFRCGWVPFHADTIWKRIKKLFGLTPEYEFVFGSRNVQLAPSKDTFYKTNVYAEIVEKYDLRCKLLYGEVLYGEIYGDEIQKGYSYGCGPGEHRLAAFELARGGEYLSALEACLAIENKNIPLVPCLYAGPYFETRMRELAKGPSVLCPAQEVREGIVIRPISGSANHVKIGRRILKLINDDYLLRDQSYWH